MIRQQSSHQREGSQEQGQVMVLLIGFVLIVLLIVTVIAAAGSVYLGHKKLLSMADSAALAAADTFELSGGSASTNPGTLLTTPGVLGATQNYLVSADIPAGISGIVVNAGTGAADSHTAKVSLSAVVHPLFINFLVPQGINITVTSTARANLLL